MKWAKTISGNKWAQYEGYSVNDTFPLGHGEKSVFILQKFIELTDEEALAVRWHMSTLDPGVHFYYPSGVAHTEAMKMSLLVKILPIADWSASLIENTIDYKEQNGLK